MEPQSKQLDVRTPSGHGYMVAIVMTMCCGYAATRIGSFLQCVYLLGCIIVIPCILIAIKRDEQSSDRIAARTMWNTLLLVAALCFVFWLLANGLAVGSLRGQSLSFSVGRFVNAGVEHSSGHSALGNFNLALFLAWVRDVSVYPILATVLSGIWIALVNRGNRKLTGVSEELIVWPAHVLRLFLVLALLQGLFIGCTILAVYHAT